VEGVGDPLSGSVHRCYDGAPSLSRERRRREGYRDIHREDTALVLGEEETVSAAKRMGGDMGGDSSVGGSRGRRW